MLTYAQWLAVLSLFFILAERLFPWRPRQRLLRPGIYSDLFYLVFNGHWLGVLLSAPWAYGWVRARYEDLLRLVPLGGGQTLRDVYRLDALGAWPLWAQFLLLFFVKDLLEWGVHNLLHRVPWLWRFHQVHHSIHHLDWIGVMRFHWAEKVVYDAFKYVILVPLGAAPQVFLWLAIFGTFWGFYNHSNLRLGLGPLRYVFNSPQMHIWHHAKNDAAPYLCNFGINLSLWDFLFRTAYWPANREKPNEVGFDGDEMFPEDALRQEFWPLLPARVLSRLPPAALPGHRTGKRN